MGAIGLTPSIWMQVWSVRQWQGLGLSLEEIQQRKARRPDVLVQDILGPLVSYEKVLDKAFVTIERKFEGGSCWENGHISSLDIENMPQEISELWNPRPILSGLLAEYRAVRERLEQKRQDLEARIAQITALEKQLARA